MTTSVGSDRPSPVWLGVAVPHDHASFVACADAGHDLITRLIATCGGDRELAWESGYRDLVEQFCALGAEFDRHGATSRIPMLAEHLPELARVSVDATVIIVAHHRAGRLWLLDGPVDEHRLCEHMPPDYAGELDLISCRSISLVELLKRRFPHATIAGSPAGTELRFRLRLTRSAVALGARCGGRYFDNIHEVRVALQHRLEGRS